MLLRTLVHQLVRKAAEEKIRDEIQRRQGGSTADGSSSSDQDAGRPPGGNLPECDIALVFALGIESGSTVDLLKDPMITRCHSYLEYAGPFEQRHLILADSGVGLDKAAQATADLIEIHKPQWVVSAGFAGALRADLRRGQIVMANHVADVAGSQLEVGFKIDPAVVRATKGLHVGRLLTVDHLVDSPEEKTQLGKQHDAIACDMETIAVARVCQSSEVRFLSVRVISDTLQDRLPPELGKLMNQPSLAGKLGAATGAIFKRPSSVKDMWRLQATATKASQSLAKFLAGVIPQLELPCGPVPSTPSDKA